MTMYSELICFSLEYTIAYLVSLFERVLLSRNKVSKVYYFATVGLGATAGAHNIFIAIFYDVPDLFNMPGCL